MSIYCFGSLNIDHVYRVTHIAAPGETINSTAYQRLCGGKGLNQSVAAVRAGANVLHAGCVGADGDLLINTLIDNGVDISHIRHLEEPSGHAVIQVSNDGENSIVIYGGANSAISHEQIAKVIGSSDSNDWLLLQNEINAIDELIRQAAAHKLNIAFNPAPFDERIDALPLDLIQLLIVNEIEGAQLSGQRAPQQILSVLCGRYPQCDILLTLGKSGASLQNSRHNLHIDAPSVTAVDTTAAGDTFVGYYLAMLTQGEPEEEALKVACTAAALSVTQDGAAQSIPTIARVRAFLAQ